MLKIIKAIHEHYINHRDSKPGFHIDWKTQKIEYKGTCHGSDTITVSELYKYLQDEMKNEI